jgi:peptide/nickel transport system permease protein
MGNLKAAWRQLARYPSAVIGMVLILGLVGIALYAVIAIPYPEAIRLWRGGEEVWGENPRTAQPVWTQLFSRTRQPQTLVLRSSDPSARKTVQEVTADTRLVTISYAFDYPYDGFPQEITVFFDASYREKLPFASMSWKTPDGRTIRLGQTTVRRAETYRLAQDTTLVRRLGGVAPQEALFADPAAATAKALRGRYEFVIEGSTFEPGSTLDAKVVIYGQVHGLAGTDYQRRDLMVGLLWGTPIALSFGLLAALGTSVVTMLIAAFGVWFGGWVDQLIQRITEVNMVLPFLPILIMVGIFYSRSIWVILTVVIALSIFGAAIKTYRAIFLQVKEAPYIEAARAYGASDGRIIVRYLVPRIVPVLIPTLISGIPTFVFLEASLALLGLGDPVLPTWGKMIDDARSQGALFNGQYYWMLEPAALLMVAGLAFAMVGFALDRIFNPRLREV